MRLFKLKTRLKVRHYAQCKFWQTCPMTKCCHYDVHTSDEDCWEDPVRYCSVAGGFVYDVPLSISDLEYVNEKYISKIYAKSGHDSRNPNLVFKKRKEGGNEI